MLLDIVKHRITFDGVGDKCVARVTVRRVQELNFKGLSLLIIKFGAHLLDNKSADHSVGMSMSMGIRFRILKIAAFAIGSLASTVAHEAFAVPITYTV